MFREKIKIFLNVTGNMKMLTLLMITKFSEWDMTHGLRQNNN